MESPPPLPAAIDVMNPGAAVEWMHGHWPVFMSTQSRETGGGEKADRGGQGRDWKEMGAGRGGATRDRGTNARLIYASITVGTQTKQWLCGTSEGLLYTGAVLRL